MTIDDQIRGEKLQYDANRDAAKIYQNWYIYENLTGEEILPSNQKQIIEKAKFTYFFSKFTYICFLGKAFEIKTIEVQGGKQIKAIQDQGIIKAIKNIYLWWWR